MAQANETTNKMVQRTTGDIIVLCFVALWGIVVTALMLLVDLPAQGMTIGIGVAVATIIVAALGFWRHSAIAAALGAAAVLSLGLIVAGFLDSATIITNGTANGTTGMTLMLPIAGALGLIMTGCAAAIVNQIRVVHSSESSSARSATSNASDTNVEQLLAQVYENSMLSDSAKRVIFREREMELMREAIEYDIAKGEYGAALTLCDEIANLFGQRETAEKFRQEIEHARRDHYETETQEAITRLDVFLSERDWSKAHQEAGRIRRLFPDTHVLEEVDHKIDAARREHKNDLEARFLQAAQHEDVEVAMELMRELDRYLTADEAAQFTEVAQGVVTKHRDNLGVRFKLAVNDHRWSEAAGIGNTIVEEFPNTKMADEVRAMLDQIRTKATQAAVSAQGE